MRGLKVTSYISNFLTNKPLPYKVYFSFQWDFIVEVVNNYLRVRLVHASTIVISLVSRIIFRQILQERWLLTTLQVLTEGFTPRSHKFDSRFWMNDKCIGYALPLQGTTNGIQRTSQFNQTVNVIINYTASLGSKKTLHRKMCTSLCLPEEIEVTFFVPLCDF